jgi:hypothetical protein
MALREAPRSRCRARFAANLDTGARAGVQKIRQVAELNHLDIPAFQNTGAEIDAVSRYAGLATLSWADNLRYRRRSRL